MPTPTTRKCGDERDETAHDAVKVQNRAFCLDDIGDAPVSLTAFPGCIEGERLTLTLRGDARAMLLYGTVDQVAHYLIGEEVKLEEKDIPPALRTGYRANVSRKMELAVNGIKDEMYGTGDVGKMAREKQGTVNGYVLKVNGQKVTPDSSLNPSFQKMAFVVGPDGKPAQKPVADLTDRDTRLLRDGRPIDEFYGGVELIVSAVIVPGQAMSTPTRAYR